jgi:NapC/NirT cytochrome c family, N-terminal region
VTDRAVLVRHPVAMAGVAITTASAVVFIALALAMFLGMLANPYAGLVVFVGLPLIFMVGLLLIPVGMRLQRKALAEGRGVEEWPVIDLRQTRTRRVALTIAILTGMNIVIVLVAGYGSLKWMESPEFCGAVCHEPMHPQYTAWQNASHSNVVCVQCHIGEGGEAFVHYKTAGIRQLFHVVTNDDPPSRRAGTVTGRSGRSATSCACHGPSATTRRTPKP